MPQWDPKTVIVVFGEDRIDGFASGTFVRGERAEDAFSTSIGPDGKGTRVVNNNKSGTLTLTLRQGSAGNATLSAIAEGAEVDNSGTDIKQLLVKTTVGESRFFAKEAWIKKMPVQEYAADETNREWVFESLKVDMHEGGL